MAVLPIITIPDPVLRKQAALIERVDAALLKLAEGMLAAMYEAPGIGLAAPRSEFAAAQSHGPLPR